MVLLTDIGQFIGCGVSVRKKIGKSLKAWNNSIKSRSSLTRNSFPLQLLHVFGSQARDLTRQQSLAQCFDQNQERKVC